MNINLPSHPHSLCHTEKKKKDQNYCRALGYNKTLTRAMIIQVCTPTKYAESKVNETM